MPSMAPFALASLERPLRVSSVMPVRQLWSARSSTARRRAGSAGALSSRMAVQSPSDVATIAVTAWMTVRPTEHGHRLAQQLLRGRSTPLMGIVTRLGEPDQERLAGLLEEILTHLYDDVGQGQRICRLCDRASCVRSATCPVGQAERAERP